ncbi:unnamed protein product [Moneuplotes crassus]|uniref:Uncharacterized protein n=1 Tax=Euplotes crassus TaxID=5936 RepID=A0AAD1UFH5_EUPCR|nr:unnamed protein product [Moneuplotes crassus]
MSVHTYQCTTKECDIEAKHYCICHQQLVCSRCNANRHYACELVRVCQAEDLEDMTKLLHDFVDGLKNKAAQYDLVENIQGLEQAFQDVNGVVKMFQANVAQCFEKDKHEDFSMLVFQGKQILSDIFEGTIFGNTTKSNPILRLLFDSQVLDTQNGNFVPPMRDINILVNQRSKALVSEFARRNKKMYEDKLKAQKKIIAMQKASELRSQIDKLKLEIKQNKFETDHIINKHRLTIAAIDEKNRDNSSIEQRECIPLRSVTLIGLRNVGKTCMGSRLCGHEFDPCTNATTGTGSSQCCTIFCGRQVKFHVFDTVRFSMEYERLPIDSLTRNNCLLLVYDITDESSLKVCQDFIDHGKETGNIVYFLVTIGLSSHYNLSVFESSMPSIL